MSLEDHKALVRKAYLEAFNQRNLDLIDEVFAPEYVVYYPGVPPILGRDAAKEAVGAFLEAFPDIVFAIEQQVAEGNLVATRWSAKGTHSGEFRGFPVKTSVVAPTGRPVTFSANDIYLIENGLVVTEWKSLSPVDVLQQVGAVTLQV